MADEVDDYELEKLQAEIQQEKQMKEMLDQSAKELRITVEELEKRYEVIENEDIYEASRRQEELYRECNEWKTRFETQEEMNQQLERQIIMLQDKIDEAKRNLKDADLVQLNQSKTIEAKGLVDGTVGSPRAGADTPKSKSTGITINISVSPKAGRTPRDMKNFDDLSDANPAMVKSMEKEKQLLYNQLRDLEWKLDQESKAYHKANDERKQYVLEINTTKGNLDGNKARQRAAVNVQQREVDEMSRSPRLLGYKELYKLKSYPKEDKDSKTESPISMRFSQQSRVSNETSSSRLTWTNSRRSSLATSKRSSLPTSRRSSEHLSDSGSRSGSLSNIPEDQRIIDPRKGPIKKTAAVKNLPSLETT